jgi:hypothetical protein
MSLDAIRAGASDIHVEPLKNRFRVRFRCDGVMTHYRDFDLAIALADESGDVGDLEAARLTGIHGAAHSLEGFGKEGADEVGL